MWLMAVLKLVNCLLKNEQEIYHLCEYIKQGNPDYSQEKVERSLRFLSFLWTMVNIENIVNDINVPEIRKEIMEVVKHKSTPAYDLIGYFNLLDSSQKLSMNCRNELGECYLGDIRNRFIQSVLSYRTQRYLNTHTSDASIESSVCSLLGIPLSTGLPRP